MASKLTEGYLYRISNQASQESWEGLLAGSQSKINRIANRIKEGDLRVCLNNTRGELEHWVIQEDWLFDF